MKDSIGRENRKHPDKSCEACGFTYRPARASSRFCSRPCAWSKNGGQNKKDQCWWTNSRGYIEGRIWLPDGTQIRVKQHRFIVEGILGRALLPTEDVHHKNGIKNDNRPENLEVIDHGKHSSDHNAQREFKRGYTLNLSAAERHARSLRAIAQGLSALGRAALARGS